MAKVVKHQWHLFDAKGQVVGRFATHISNILRGKYKPTYTGNVDCGDTVVIINADKVVFTGKKWETKIYSKHSGFIGGLTQRNAAQIRDRAPERILLHAIRGMLPKTVHKLPQLKRLHVYSKSEHPFKHIFPNQPIAIREAKSPDSIVKHFQILPEYAQDFKKNLVEVPPNKEGIVDFAQWLRINQPLEYAELMSTCEVRLSAKEYRQYSKTKEKLDKQVSLQKVIDHGAKLESKYNYGTNLKNITLDNHAAASV